MVPFVVALARPIEGGLYLGTQYNTDDHMVYAAWMRQAMEGRILFDNRFTVDEQPGLTFHAYFLVLGWIAKVVGIPLASNLARAAFGFFAVLLLGRFIERLGWSGAHARVALVTGVFGAGLGFAMFRPFGVAFPETDHGHISEWLFGGLSADAWQPEAFLFPSLLTNGLFAFSLCLWLVGLGAILDAHHSRRAVGLGCLAVALLMNVHSYDVLLMALVGVAYLCAGPVSNAWLGRTALIALGAVPAALWFWWVLRQDPVFQARAATETYSPGVRQYLAALAPGLVFAVGALVGHGRATAAWVLGIGLVGLALFAGAATPEYWLGYPAWIGCLAAACVVTRLARSEKPAWNVLVAWLAVGLVAIYFPALFQRKLAMSLAVPWMLLAGWSIAEVASRLPARERLLATALGVLVLCATSLAWLLRETTVYIARNVANTAVHPVHLEHELADVLLYLNERRHARTVLLAMPGVPRGAEGGGFVEPAIPDFNPIASGLAGVYTFAGHWSETPHYAERRSRLVRELFSERATPESQAALIEETRADYILAPLSLVAAPGPEGDLRRFGEAVYEGNRYVLIRVGGESAPPSVR